MKTRVISLKLIIVMMLPMMISCTKDKPEELQRNNESSVAESDERVWPYVAAAIIIGVIGKLAEGQATDVTYHENGNLASYSCTNIGTCHINSMSEGNSGDEFSSIEALYIGEQEFSNFELLRTNEGDILFGTSLDNPTRKVVFENDSTFSLSIPFVIDNPTVLSRLGVSEPIEIAGDYSVYTDRSRRAGVQFIQLN